MANMDMGNANNPTTFIMCNIAKEGTPEVWYLENSYNNHMNGNKSLFSFIDNNFMSKIKMRNNGTIPIVGKGYIMVRTKKHEKKEIQNIYFPLSMTTYW